MNAIDLIAQSDPVGLYVVRPAKQFNFPSTRAHSFNDAVDFVGLVTRGTHLGNDNVAVEAAIDAWIPLHSHQTVLLAVIEPVSSSSRSNYPLQLISLHPDYFVDSLVAPQLQALPAKFHGTASHPQKQQSLVLQGWDAQLTHLIVRHGTVRQFHVYVPRWISHNHSEFTQNCHVQVSKVALDPLWRIERQFRSTGGGGGACAIFVVWARWFVSATAIWSIGVAVLFWLCSWTIHFVMYVPIG